MKKLIRKLAKVFVGGISAAACLLYTSDAADERSSVDLGGRRIIKKKKKIDTIGGLTDNTNRIEEQKL